MNNQAIREEAKRQAERVALELERTAHSIRRLADRLDNEKWSACTIIAEIVQEQDRRENLNAILWQLVMSLEKA